VIREERMVQTELVKHSKSHINIQVNMECQNCASLKNQDELVLRLKSEVNNLLGQIKIKDEELMKF